MATNTPNRAYTYPQSTDHDRLWEHFQELATDLDTDIAANEAIFNTAVSFTPTLYSVINGARVSLSKTVTNAFYINKGKLVTAWADVTASAGSSSGAGLSLPFAAGVRQIICGTAAIMGGTPPTQTSIAYMTGSLDAIFVGSYTAVPADIVSGQTFRYQVTYIKA